MTSTTSTVESGQHTDHWRVAVDVGGTFVDFAAINDRTGELHLDKQPSRPESLLENVMEGLDSLPVRLAEVQRLAHGTTHGLNSLVQERGARVGLVTTRGFRDVLGIGRASRPALFDLRYTPADPLVPRRRRLEVGERIDADGEVLRDLDQDELDAVVDLLVADGVVAIAVAFVNAYANPDHERRAAQRIRARYPELSVVASHELSREWREFERTSTAVANAFIQPGFGAYVRDFTTSVADRGHPHAVAFMTSSGSVLPANRVAEHPVHTLMSGPAGGVLGGRVLTDTLGIPNVICADVGGTTYDVSIILDGRIQERHTLRVGRQHLLAPCIDIVSVGAGGGSIARIGAASGTITVGPDSAGATPGPVAFGRGGTDFTVTDAALLLGRIDPARFFAGRMNLDLNAAADALDLTICQPSGLEPDQAADGVLEIAEANMANAIRRMTTERGLDVRDFTMLSYGGGGGLFAAHVCEQLGISELLVPHAPANFSAWGMLNAAYREDRATTTLIPLRADHRDVLLEELDRLGVAAREALADYGLGGDGVAVSYSVDARFTGQEHTITTPVEIGADDVVASTARAFADLHRQRYGHGSAAQAIEVVTVRAQASAAPPTLPETQVDPSSTGGSVGHRRVYLRGQGWADVPVYERTGLGRGDVISGPAVIEEWSSTLLVPSGWVAEVIEHGALRLQGGPTS